jgi:hypothetical protein
MPVSIMEFTTLWSALPVNKYEKTKGKLKFFILEKIKFQLRKTFIAFFFIFKSIRLVSVFSHWAERVFYKENKLQPIELKESAFNLILQSSQMLIDALY